MRQPVTIRAVPYEFEVIIMTEQILQLQNSLEAIRNRYKNLNKKIDIIRSHVESNTMFKSKSITDILKELTEFSKLQNICAENYKALFNEELPEDATLDNIKSKIQEYNNEVLKKETGAIIDKFRTLHSDDSDCQSAIDKFAAQLEGIDCSKMTLEEYKEAVADYIKFYSCVESNDTDERINFSLKETVFSEDSGLLLNLIQGMISIS